MSPHHPSKPSGLRRHGRAAACVIGAAAGLAAAGPGSALVVSNTIPVGSGPQDVAFTPDATRAYVTNGTGNSVSVINTALNSVSATITGVTAANGIGAGGNAVVAGVVSGSAGAAVIDTVTNTVVGTATGLGGPIDSVAVTANGAFSYVPAGTNLVKVTNATQTTSASPAAQTSYSEVALSPGESRAWVTSYNGGAVTVFDTSTLSVVNTIPLTFGLIGVAITPDGSAAYVADCSAEVIPINTATYAVGASIPMAGCPWAVAVDPTGKVAFVSRYSGGAVSAIDLRTNTVIAEVPVGSQPQGVAVSPAGGTVYVVNSGSNTVSVIPFGVPGSPTAASAVAGNAQADISWTAPNDDGGFPVTYTAQAVEDPSKACTVPAPAVTCTVTGLANGTAYTFRVTAANVMGDSQASAASTAVTPTGPAPQPGPAAETSSTTAPVTPSIPTGTPMMAARLVASRSAMVSGQTVRLAVRASNTGTGPASAASACVRLPRGLVVARAPGALRVGSSVCFRLGALAAGATASRAFTARAVAVRPQVARVTASTRAVGNARAWATPEVIRIAPRPARPAVTG